MGEERKMEMPVSEWISRCAGANVEYEALELKLELELAFVGLCFEPSYSRYRRRTT
jgi:hypothetical protein